MYKVHVSDLIVVACTMFLLWFSLTGCSKPASAELDIRSDIAHTAAGGAPINLLVRNAAIGRPVAWSLGPQCPGKLELVGSGIVRYWPPAAGSLSRTETVIITAWADGTTRTVELEVRPWQAASALIAGDMLVDRINRASARDRS